jgi:ribonuclease HII
MNQNVTEGDMGYPSKRETEDWREKTRQRRRRRVECKRSSPCTSIEVS